MNETCNVCGRTLIRDDEKAIGACAVCMNETEEETSTNCTSKGGYISDIHGNTGHVGDCRKVKVGDSGQRYMVVADFDGVEKPVGYCSNPTGGSLMEGAKKWPACTNPRVVDRWWKPTESVDGHEWGFYKKDDYETCRLCVNVRRADKKNSPCRGKAKIDLR
jgi:hypothetical protein